MLQVMLQGLFLLGALAIIIHLLQKCWHLRLQLLATQQELQHQQQIIEQTSANIHNGSLQLLTYLIREVQTHEVPQQEMLKHLHTVYQDVLANTQNLEL